MGGCPGHPRMNREADLDVLVSTQTFSSRKEGHGISILYYETYQRTAPISFNALLK